MQLVIKFAIFILYQFNKFVREDNSEKNLVLSNYHIRKVLTLFISKNPDFKEFLVFLKWYLWLVTIKLIKLVQYKLLLGLSICLFLQQSIIVQLHEWICQKCIYHKCVWYKCIFITINLSSKTYLTLAIILMYCLLSILYLFLILSKITISNHR